MTELTWETNLDAATQRATRERSFILADFSKDH